MISDKMQMMQLSNVHVSFMLASSLAFSVSLGHIFLLCLRQAENSTLFFKSERGKKGGSPVHVLVTEPLGSFGEDMKEKSLLSILLINLLQANYPIQRFSEREVPQHHDIYLKVYESSHVGTTMAAVYLHICSSIHIKIIAVKYSGISQIQKVLYKTNFYSDSNVIALKCYYKCTCRCQHLHCFFKGN